MMAMAFGIESNGCVQQDDTIAWMFGFGTGQQAASMNCEGADRVREQLG